MVVLRDFWQRGDGSENDRVRAGTKMEVSVGAAMAGLEAGSMRRAADNDWCACGMGNGRLWITIST